MSWYLDLQSRKLSLYFIYMYSYIFNFFPISMAWSKPLPHSLSFLLYNLLDLPEPSYRKKVPLQSYILWQTNTSQSPSIQSLFLKPAPRFMIIPTLSSSQKVMTSLCDHAIWFTPTIYSMICNPSKSISVACSASFSSSIQATMSIWFIHYFPPTKVYFYGLQSPLPKFHPGHNVVEMVTEDPDILKPP